METVMTKLFRPFAALAALFLAFAPPAMAQIAVDITQGNIQPLPIAVPGFVAIGNDNGASAASPRSSAPTWSVPACSVRWTPNRSWTASPTSTLCPASPTGA